MCVVAIVATSWSIWTLRKDDVRHSCRSPISQNASPGRMAVS
jgi:hypothetical protein